MLRNIFIYVKTIICGEFLGSDISDVAEIQYFTLYPPPGSRSALSILLQIKTLDIYDYFTGRGGRT
ncbi:MAG: hypothetical protein CMM41_01515 [Rhodospirillaceae bacterium]|nr:hypothetical protein [Rhodospirillaceae bacterium]|tara:strand:+ start:135 stop:332 length:198 start_codon:yes stop_codon:yes gene_type:complete